MRTEDTEIENKLIEKPQAGSLKRSTKSNANKTDRKEEQIISKTS